MPDSILYKSTSFPWGMLSWFFSQLHHALLFPMSGNGSSKLEEEGLLPMKYQLHCLFFYL